MGINLGLRQFVTESGAVGQLETFLGADGEDTDPADAVVVVGQLPCGGWVSLLVSDFESRSLH